MSSAIDIDVVKKTELYCNAGVILFDLKTIREKAILSTIQEKMNGVDFKYADQSIFNLVFNKQIKKLPVKFNLYTPLQKSSYKTLSKYYRINEITTEIDLFQAKKKPIIAHFYGLRQCCKPWNKINACVFSKPYRKTMTALFGKHSLEKWPKSKNAKEKFIEILSFLGNKYLPNSLYMCLKNHKKIT
jgi:lipopolysaccharide biosynthesis glycosyltransferase